MSYLESYDGTNPDGNTDTMCKVYVDEPAILRLSDCIPSTGVYTLQFWAKSGTASTIFIESSGIHRYIDISADWTKYVFTFTVTDDSDKAIYFSFPVGVFYLYHVKLEMGDTASEWTPAPEYSTSITETEPDARLFRLSDKYHDKLGCDNGLWYIERNTRLITLNGLEDWWYNDSVYGLTLPMVGNAFDRLPGLCSHYAYSDNYFTVYNDNANTFICFSRGVASSLDAFKTWLSSNNVTVLLPANPTQITLANYIQSTLNNIVASGNLTILLEDKNVDSIRGAIIVKPIVLGTVNEDRSTTILNNSDDEIGFIYQIHCKGLVTNPVIYHSESNQHIRINGIFKLNDVITIDTRKGHKSLTKTYVGQSTNIINKLDNTSKWLQLQCGYNHLIQTADSGADFMDSVIIYTNEYEGV